VDDELAAYWQIGAWSRIHGFPLVSEYERIKAKSRMGIAEFQTDGTSIAISNSQGAVNSDFTGE